MDGNPLDEYILDVVRRVQRNRQGAVLPRMVQPMLPVDLSEQRVRLYMVRLWRCGRLVRVRATRTLPHTRNGYRMPTVLEAWLDRNLMIFLGRRAFGFSIADILQLFGLEYDVLWEYLLQMEACGRVLLRGDVVQLPRTARDYQRAA